MTQREKPQNAKIWPTTCFREGLNKFMFLPLLPGEGGGEGSQFNELSPHPNPLPGGEGTYSEFP